MRLPPFDRFIRGLQLVGALTVGIIIGCIILNTFHAAYFESFYKLRSELEAKLTQYEQDIQNLSQYKSQHTVIKSIKLKLEEESNEEARPRLDTLTEKELLTQVRDDLSIFIGQSIYDIDSNAQFARKLLEKKVYTGILGNDFTIELKTVLLVDNTLQIWMSVRKYTPPPS